MKKMLSIALCALLLVSAFGCGGAENAPAQAGQTGENGKTEASPLDAKGRYVESEIALPLPEGYQEQMLMGVFRAGDQMCAVTGAANPAEDYAYHFFRMKLDADGASMIGQEPWLDEIAAKGGNDMSVTAGDDGKLYYSCTAFDADYNMYPEIAVSEDGGKTGTVLSGDLKNAMGNLTSLGVLGDGSLAAMDFYGGAAVLFDAEGKKLEELNLQAGFLANCTARGNVIASAAPGGKAVRVIDRAAGTEADYEFSFDEQRGAQLALSPKGDVYLADATGLYRRAADGTLWERLIDGSTSALGMPGFYPGKLYVDPGEPYDTLYLCGNNSVYVYSYDEDAVAAPDKELTVFSLEQNETVQQAVVTFSREHSNVKVTYKVAMDGSTGGTKQDYIKALNTELLAGTGPDVLILDGLPVQSYIEKDVLTDIGSIVDGAEPILENIRKAAGTDGALYYIPTGIKVPLVLGSEGSEAAFTDLATLANAAESAVNGPLLSSCAFSFATLGQYLYNYYGAGLVSGKTEEITSFLENAGRISKATNCTERIGDGWAVLEGMSQDELLEDFADYIDMPEIVSFIGGKAKAVLTQPYSSVPSMMNICAAADQIAMNPVVTSVCGQYIPTGLAGLNKAGKEQETAAEFIQMLLSEKAQGGNQYASQFPVNKAALNAMLAFENPNVSSSTMLDDGTEFETLWPTKIWRERMGAIIPTLDSPILRDAELDKMLLPEIVRYLSGEASLGDAAGRIESLMNTYLSE